VIDGLRPVPDEQVGEYTALGFWDERSLGTVLATGLAAAPGNPMVFRSKEHSWAGTFADVHAMARRAATGLAALGVNAGDVVVFQLPNWVEAAVTFYAAAMLGAVVAPVVHFYGPHELGHVLRETGARVLVTYESFGTSSGTQTLQRTGVDVEHVLVVGQPSWTALLEHEPLVELNPVDPASAALVAYTSGTTSAPKGVVHTHRSIGSEIRQLSAVQPPAARPSLVGAPVGHGIGMLAALLLPVHQGRPVHLIDQWDPSAVLAAMLAEDLTGGTGATYFLTSLLDHPSFTDDHLERMRFIGLGGSAVPRAVTDRATHLGLSIVRLYGSTEHPSVTGCIHADPLEKRLATDGRPLPGVQLRLSPDGEIQTRGPDLFAGYVDPAQTARVFTDDGWYRTEDVGVLDADGYLSITDRLKDIVIRGGENISAAEVEEALMRMPGVAEAAVVSAPDARLGEHAAALLRLHPHASIDLPAVQQHLSALGLAKQKWPEELHVVADYPRTASGKVQKAVLRERLRSAAPPG
jgi:acyl-CoA synthetase